MLYNKSQRDNINLTSIVQMCTMIWMIRATETNPVNWGWKLDDNEFVPVMCEMNTAPDPLLKIIHCKCKTGCSGNRSLKKKTI